MRVTAITRFKHAGILELLRRLNWTQTDLAKKSGLSTSVVGNIINLKHRPTAEAAQKIQFAFGEAGCFLDILAEWPETFHGNGNSIIIEQTEDITLLNDSTTPLINDKVEITGETLDLLNIIEMLLKTLSPMEAKVISKRFFGGESPRQIADKLGVWPTQITNWEAKALRKLRHPTRIRYLAPWMPDYAGVTMSIEYLQDLIRWAKRRTEKKRQETEIILNETRSCHP